MDFDLFTTEDTFEKEKNLVSGYVFDSESDVDFFVIFGESFESLKSIKKRSTLVKNFQRQRHVFYDQY